MKSIYIVLIFLILNFLIFIISLNILAYPTNNLIYTEKLQKAFSDFNFNYLLDLKIQYSYSVINKNNDNKANFLSTTLISLFDTYLENKRIKLDSIEKEKLLSFYFNKLAIYIQNNRSLNNQYNLKSSFYSDFMSKNLLLFKTNDDKKKEDKSLIYFQISFEYDFKSSTIILYCKKYYLFTDQSFEKSFVLKYNYISFYNDIKNLFISKIMSFFLNQNFYNLEIELNSSAFIEIDNVVVLHFLSDYYPSICEIVLEEGEHFIKIFEDGYDSWERKLVVTQNSKISISLQKKIAHCKLIINSFPANAKVRIANNFVGNSPVSIALPSGNYFLIISHDGYESKEIYLSISDNEFEKKVYVYLMPVNTTDYYINYSQKILNQSYQYFFNGCYGLALAIGGSILYNYFIQFSNSSFYNNQTIGIYASLAIIAGGIITFAIFEILSLTELWKYYQFINYYTL
ncbi:MAG: PEGA domain-containing protein [Exilispira sp.]